MSAAATSRLQSDQEPLGSWKGIGQGELAIAGVERVGGCVRVPYRERDGSTAFVKIFADSGRSWYEPKGIDLIPFGLEFLTFSDSIAARSTLFVCEGESDALCTREHFCLFEGEFVWSHVLGLPGAGVWRRSWRRYLAPFPLIYLLGDGDAPGQRMNWKIKADVPWARPVTLPAGQDVRSLLQAGGAAALVSHLREADLNARIVTAGRCARTLAEFRELINDGKTD